MSDAPKPKIPIRGYEGINPHVRNIVRGFTHCCRVGCLARGIWLPVLLIRLEGQVKESETVRFPIPILLCDKCKDGCSARDILQEKTRKTLTLAIFGAHKKNPNWDTVSFDWRDVGPKLPLPKFR